MKNCLSLLFFFLSSTFLLAQTPGSPTITSATGINNGGLIQFDPPLNNNGSAITNYEYSTDGGASWITPSPAVVKSPIIFNGGLTNCSSYNVKIRAVNANGPGDASNTVSMTPRSSTNTLGTDWVLRASPSDHQWTSVCYGNGIFVAVANAGPSSNPSAGNRVMTSFDGITWTLRASAASYSWESVTYGNGLFVAVALTGGLNQVMTSPDGINWTIRTTPVTNSWRRVTYGNGLFVAVASSGTGNRVMTSPDGINWTIRTTPADNNWTSVTYGNGTFVAVSTSGTGNRVMTSPDGITWTTRSSVSDIPWLSVTYGNGLFVAVSNSNGLMTSPDGITWTSRTVPVNIQWWNVTFAEGLFVAVSISGTGNRVMTSTDGINWTVGSSAADINWYSVTYGKGVFVSVALNGTVNQVMTSNIITSAADAPIISSVTPSNNGALINLTTTQSSFVTPVTAFEYSIDNGLNWLTQSTPSVITPLNISGLNNGTSYDIRIRALNSVGASCASNMVSVVPLGAVPGAPTDVTVTGINAGGLIEFNPPVNNGGAPITNYEYSIDNGNTWITPNPPTIESPITISGGLTNCNNYLVKLRAVNSVGSGSASSAVTLAPNNSTFTTGTNWVSRTAAANLFWYGVTYGNGLFVAVSNFGTGTRVMTSPDGTDWTLRATPADNAWLSIAYGNGLFVALAQSGDDNRVMYSPDGINWSLSTCPRSSWVSITYGNGIFVAVANNGTGYRAMTSIDGINWTARKTPADNNWQKVIYGNGTFVAVSNTGTGNRIMSSPDGVNWTIRTSPADNNWTSVAFGNGQFVAVASSGTGNRVMTSSDGITWTLRTSAADNYWISIAYGNGLFVAVASSGTGNRVMTSSDGITWTTRTSATDNGWTSIAYGKGTFVAVSTLIGGGTIQNRVMTNKIYNLSPNVPVITGITTSDTTATINFTSVNPIISNPITNIEYSINNGVSWVTPNPAVTSSPLLLSGFTNGSYQIGIRAVNSFGTSCSSQFNRVNFPSCETTSDTTNITTCGSYSWNGQTYNASGTYSWTGVNAAGCDSIVILNLTINPNLPASVSIASNAVNNIICSGSSVTFTATPTNGGSSPSYQWKLNGNNVGTNSNIYTTNTLVNNDVVSVVMTSNAVCATGSPETSNSITTTVNPTRTLSVSIASSDADNKICTGASVTFTATPNTVISRQIGGDNVLAYTYQWKLNGNNVGTNSATYTTSLLNNNDVVYVVATLNNSLCAVNSPATSNSITTTVNQAGSSTQVVNNCGSYSWNGQIYTTSGTYTWTGTNAAGCDSVATLNLTVRQLSSSSVSQTATGSYVWHAQTYSTSGIYTWIGTNAVGCDSTVTLNLTINPVVVNNVTNVCPYIGTNQTVSYTATVAGASSYNWSLPAYTQLVSGQGTRSITIRILNGFANVNNKQLKVTPAGGSLQIIYLSAQAPVTPAAITASSSSVCASLGTNVPITYTIPKAYAAVSYIWSAQNGTTNITSINGAGANDTSVAVTFTSGFTSSNITVQSVNDCGVSGSRSFAITKDAPSQPGLISGPTNACEYIGETGQSATYTVPAVANMDSYNWSLPNGVFAVTEQGTRTISFKYPSNFTSGTVAVTVTNGCGTGSARSLSVTRLQAGTPSIIDVINTGACPNRTYSYTLSAMPSNATSVQWTVPTGGTIVSGQGTTSITVSYANTVISGDVKAQAVNNCSISGYRFSNVKLPACPAPGFASNKIVNTLPSEGLSVKAFPNPTTSSFNLQVITADSKEVKVKIMDVQGRMIQSLIVAPYATTNIGNDLKSGVYMVETRQGGEVKMVRVVKY